MEKLSTENEAFLTLSENYKKIRASLDNTREGDGRNVTLLAATKTVLPEVINYATQTLGITDIGENRVQELLDKYDSLEKEGVNIHFIGHLQTNKVKYIIDKVCMIHSVDSERLAAEIDKQAAKHGIKMDVLCEINIGKEEDKGGVMPEEAIALLTKIRSFEHLNLRGIMTIAPKCEKKEQYLKFFKETYRIFIDFFGKTIHNIYIPSQSLPVLSMGMSDNYDIAAECGSDIVRVGTALFGRRV